MTKTFRIVWAASAQSDLTRLIRYISQDRPETALRVLKNIRLKANSLRAHAFRGRIVPELRTVSDGRIRELIIAPWRLIYRIEGSEIQVLGLFDNRMDLEEILLTRLLNAD